MPAHYLIDPPVDPRGHAERSLSGLEPTRRLVVLYGLGAGHHLAEAHRRCPDALGFLVMSLERGHYADARRAHPEVMSDPRVAVAYDWQEFQAAFMRYASRWNGLVLITINAARLGWPEHYAAWLDLFHRLVMAIQTDVATTLRFHLDWQRNLLRNLHWIPSSWPASSAFGRWEGLPAVLVSAGPSLDRDLWFVRAARPRALVLAVGTVVPLLVREGIEPDLVVAFDGGWDNYWGHFRGVTCRAPLVWDGILHHRALAEWAGPRVIMRIWPADTWYASQLGVEVGHVRVGPSASNTMLDLAIQMGADPIVLVGQDLAYPGGRSHAGGTNLVSRDYVRHIEHYAPDVAEGVDGQPIRTTRTMQIMRASLEERIATSGRRVINCSGGARIAGAEPMEASRALGLLTEDVEPARHELFRRLKRPAGWNLDRFADYLRVNWLFCEQTLQHRSAGRDAIEGAIKRPEAALARFANQAVWEGIKAGLPDAEVADRYAAAMRHTLPLLEEACRTWDELRRKRAA